MPRKYIPKKKKELVFIRAKYRCEYCQSRADVALETFEIEHILPVTKSGSDDLRNLALACRGCNSRKAIRNWIIDKTTNKKVLLFNPRIEKWKEHFEWSSDFLKVKGKTLMGKVTVDALQLNRLGVVNIRKLMILGKIHPPLDTIS
ncbi:MAG: HNH endonuclease [Saprospiraceae bacterium]